MDKASGINSQTNGRCKNMSKGIKLPDITFNKPEPKVKGAKGNRTNEQRRPRSVARIELNGIHRTLQGLEHGIKEGIAYDKDYAVSKIHALNYQVSCLQIAVKKANDMGMVGNVNLTQVDNVKNRILDIKGHLEATL